jgi:hypothetical protein
MDSRYASRFTTEPRRLQKGNRLIQISEARESRSSSSSRSSSRIPESATQTFELNVKRASPPVVPFFRLCGSGHAFDRRQRTARNVEPPTAKERAGTPVLHSPLLTIFSFDDTGWPGPHPAPRQLHQRFANWRSPCACVHFQFPQVSPCLRV